MHSGDERLVQILPSSRQMNIIQMGFYGFIHFTVNTFTDREWGDGKESPSIFNPEHLDAGQWARSLKSAGMKGMILTCKHHDGFCLWPSEYTRHSVRSSPWRNGKGDVVREAAEACAREGMQFGIYLSPWDRNNSYYGQGSAYDDYFVAQLRELLTGYGKICSVWLDGACGEGPNGRVQHYDWERYYSVIRELQPEACIHVCGPDIRWCGNEAGDTRPSEWSVVPRRTMDTEKISKESQKTEDAAFRRRKIQAGDRDLGSRAVLMDEADLIFYPAEVNTSIRPGWFWHESENSQLRSVDELLDIYERSVGGNATFLLNVPPNREGLIAQEDVSRLRELGDRLRNLYACPVAERECSGIESSPILQGSAENLLSESNGIWMPKIDSDPAAIFFFHEPHHIIRIMLREELTFGQRVERFALDGWNGEKWKELQAGTVIGSCRIVRLDCRVSGIRLRILDSRMEPVLKFMGMYTDDGSDYGT